MACIDANGKITRSAELILLALLNPLTIEQTAVECRLPLFRVRGSIRELGKTGLVIEVNGKFHTTAKGVSALEGTPII